MFNFFFINRDDKYNNSVIKEEESPSSSIQPSSSLRKTVKCLKCDKVFSTRRHLQKHAYMHYERKHKCDQCDKTFRMPGEVRKHAKLVHLDPTKPYTCNVCGITFRQKSILAVHMSTHTGKRFECDQCDAGFINRPLLDRHCDKVHKGVRFTCTVCKKQFTDPKYLKKHMKTHDPFYNPTFHTCPVCGKQVQKLKLHVQRIHGDSDGRRRFVCDVCGVTLLSDVGFTMHMRNHKGEKPYVCDICGKRFNAKPNMLEHRRIHTKEKPYVCHVCDKAFTQRTPMVNHVRSHTGEKPYTCQICARGFASRMQMKQHKCYSKRAKS